MAVSAFFEHGIIIACFTDLLQISSSGRIDEHSKVVCFWVPKGESYGFELPDVTNNHNL